MQEESVDLRKPEIIFASQPQESVVSQAMSRSNSEVSHWSPLKARDYVNAYVLNEAGEAMVLESFPNGNAWGSWQMIGGEIEPDEDPLTAVQKNLLQRTGCSAEHWLYLGTFVVDGAEHLGVGHFFCAQQTRRILEPPTLDFDIRWVPRKQIKRALLDGRIAAINYAIAAALALVMCEDV
jgi:8-oxo-dGTP pyrophosphatase MutT (NUDIX family)